MQNETESKRMREVEGEMKGRKREIDCMEDTYEEVNIAFLKM